MIVSTILFLLFSPFVFEFSLSRFSTASVISLTNLSTAALFSPPHSSSSFRRSSDTFWAFAAADTAAHGYRARSKFTSARLKQIQRNARRFGKIV